jgi:hypothetical protein
VAHRRAGGILERTAASGHRDDLGAQQSHPEHVVRLAFHVPLAHEDLHGQPEQGARRRGRDAVHARAGLSDQPRTPHAPGQHRLSHHIVDLVGAGVRQVFPFEQNGHAKLGRQPQGGRQRGGAARVRRE